MKNMIKILLILMSAAPYLTHSQDLDWAYRLASSSDVQGNSITVDNSGNIITCGEFDGSTDFDPGPGTFNMNDAGFSDIFIQKVDDQKNLIWAKRIGAGGYDSANDLITDSQGNIYCVGHISSSQIVDFDPGVGIYNVTPGSGWNTAFILKLNSNGDFQWVKTFSAINAIHDIYMSEVTVDASDNVYIGGGFQGTVDFDPNAGTLNLTSNGDNDAFLLKLDGNGSFIFAGSSGGSGFDQIRGIDLDVAGNIYVAGFFQGTVDFDPGPGTDIHSSLGDEDCFVVKFAPTGIFTWAKTFGSTQEDRIYDMQLDDVGNIYSVGYYEGTTDFDPGLGVVNKSNQGWLDMFILKLDVNGDYSWVKVAGGIGNDILTGVEIDQSGDIYTTGEFYSTVDFDADGAGLNLTSYGTQDILVQKHLSNGDLAWAEHFGANNNDIGNAIAVDSYKNVYTIGEFRLTSNFAPTSSAPYNLAALGNPSTFVQKLQQCTDNGSTQIITACESYTWIDGNTYTSSTVGNTHTLMNVTGCDSVVTLNLTINNITSGTDVVTECEQYTWIDGITYTADNSSATHILTNSNGCDSVVTLNLTINSITANVSMTNNVLTAMPSGVTYQWLDCNAGYAEVAGENSQEFSPLVNGSYAVAVSQNGCTDTSNCITIATIGIEENSLGNVELYPNPTNGNFTVNFDGLLPKEIALYDTRGKLVFEESNLEKTNTYHLKLDPGLYLLEVRFNSGKSFTKVLIEK